MSFPIELTKLPQWVVWEARPRADGKVDKVPINPYTGREADITDPSVWTTFEYACEVAPRVTGIGFAFSPTDPFTFIDLDVDNELTRKIYERFESYSALSQSGKGCHIIIKGNVPSAFQDKWGGIYPHKRFAALTGNVLRDLPLVDCQSQLDSLYAHLMQGRQTTQVARPDEPQVDDDFTIYQMAINASNGAKAKDLWDGNWQLHYPSQSEADYALIDILGFYSDNREQIQRLFLRSALGQRDKAKRKGYVSGMVDRSFDRKPIKVDLSGLDALVASGIKKAEYKPDLFESLRDEIFDSGQHFDPETGSRVEFPPGLVGQIADFVFHSSPRPLKQVALATALGVVAGIAGRAYNVSHTGLNLYIMVLGVSGVGKNSIGSGINQIANSLNKVLPQAKTFFGPGEIASAPALAKWLANGNPSFVSYTGEVGHMLSQMRLPAQMSFKRLLLHLYSASGPNQVLGEQVWSDKDKNLAAVNSPAFTWIGETTPETFNGAISESSIKEGLVPRMLILEAPIKRPNINPDHAKASLTSEAKNTLAELAAHCLTNNSQNKSYAIPFDQGAERLLGLQGEFSLYCDRRHAEAQRDVVRDAWNRTHLKAMKIAALVAVGINYTNPVITEDCAMWAIKLALQDLRSVLHRLESGEFVLDSAEEQQVAVMQQVINQWWTETDWKKLETYAAKQFALYHKLWQSKLVPHSYISRKLISMACFRKDRMGPSIAIARTIKILTEQGVIREVPTNQMQGTFGTTLKAYAPMEVIS